MQCLLCRNEIPRVHRFVKVDPYFCSDAHKSEYQVETERLMLSNLLELQKKYLKVDRRRLTSARPDPAPVGRALSLQADF